MRYPEEELIGILSDHGVDFACSLPCEKIGNLLAMIGEKIFHVPLTREEEGVGICAGAALSGRRPAMFVQSSGIGNMINALLSLTGFYQLPLALFVSRRGIYKEKIKAQTPMGRRLPGILDGAGIHHTVVNTRKDFRLVGKRLEEVYKKSRIHAFFLSPAIWEKSTIIVQQSALRAKNAKKRIVHEAPVGHRVHSPELTRFEILNIVAPHLDSKVVVCNLGFPSKELFHIRHQPSHFYMLGSMGMVTPIGLGISLTSKKHVIAIEGDGSLLMNPGSLATAAYFSPENLTILAIDNGSYGSTGNQPTFTQSCVDLASVAEGFGIKNTVKVADEEGLTDVMKNPGAGFRFVHVLAVSGNKDVPNIPLHHLDIKKQVQDFLSRNGL